ncbi:response regulator transcription factor [Parachitinimonas caeni]|uniref:Response regulator n=1 Tax=Parachitinimonas caeni TaxID=3031301 RepID=A0ABT7DRT7_9NEIS|nr:response regulator [Parachitinimonas caeni]MDK2122781.1 response regulator [Parachitinimonas caeni]
MHKILIVEDQPDIRTLVRVTLEFEDFEIHEAGDGVSGLKLAEAIRPDLVLLDVMMQGELDGYQVCSRIKANGALHQTKVVLLTARGQASDREMGRKAGCDQYMLKPFSPLELIETIDQLLAPA